MGEDGDGRAGSISLELTFLVFVIFCTLMVIYTLASSDAGADTHVGGHISQDTTWNISGSPYIVFTDIYVEENVTLTIEPGVHVKSNFTDLTVHGNLTALGTQGDPVRFSTNTNFEWRGIIVTEFGRVDLNWCLISEGEYGLDLLGTRHSSIENITVTGSTYGLYFRHCSNLTLENIDIYDSYYGLYLHESYGITFTDVHLRNSSFMDIFIAGSSEVMMYHNHTFVDCSSNGRPLYYFYGLENTRLEYLEASMIMLSYCEGVVVNLCNVSGSRGIVLSHSVGSTISNCNISLCGRGIELMYSGGSSLNSSNGNLVHDNVFLDNEYAIRLHYSDFNTISDNLIMSNEYGVYSYLSSSNMVFHNNFIDNDEHVYQSSSWRYSNYYDNLREGNYWDDYEGEDVGGDSIGDESYYVAYYSFDTRPLMVPWTGMLPPDTTPPFFVEEPELSEESLIIPREFILITFEVSERGHYEITIDTDGVEGFDNSTDMVLSDDMLAGGNDRLWNGDTNSRGLVDDGDYGFQIMIWDASGNPLDSPFEIGTLSVQRNTDGDLFVDVDDAFPNDPHEWSDFDNDGIGDNSDPDMDGDGVENNRDRFPDDPDEWGDLDGDGIGDNADPDDNDNNIHDIVEIPLVLTILVIPLLAFYFTDKKVKAKKEAMEKEKEEEKEEVEKNEE